jgi:DNA-binding LacI/PurR family transcriptional regulator
MAKITRLEDLAEIAGVSIATVSRALNDSPAVHEETKRRIWKIAREHKYSFRPHMPTVISSASPTIAIVIPTPQSRKERLLDQFFLELIGGVGEAARDSGCDFLVSHIAPKKYEDLSSLMEANRADGVIFLGQSYLHERLNRLAEHESRFVVWGAALPGQKYCSIGSDNLKGGRRATSHLLRLGRKRIAFFGDTEAPEAMQRYDGYVEALRGQGMSPDPMLVQSVHFEIESAEAAVDKLIGQGVTFDGIVAASDLIAIGVIRALLKAGLRVPEDVSVVGYDNIELAKYSTPALTTISQDMTKAGRLLVSKLLSSGPISNMQSERLPTEIIVRETCGA